MNTMLVLRPDVLHCSPGSEAWAASVMRHGTPTSAFLRLDFPSLSCPFSIIDAFACCVSTICVCAKDRNGHNIGIREVSTFWPNLTRSIYNESCVTKLTEIGVLIFQLIIHFTASEDGTGGQLPAATYWETAPTRSPTGCSLPSLAQRHPLLRRESSSTMNISICAKFLTFSVHIWTVMLNTEQPARLSSDCAVRATVQQKSRWLANVLFVL